MTLKADLVSAGSASIIFAHVVARIYFPEIVQRFSLW